ncbi:MAG TPA: hypothetical protein PKA88_30115 [Polyangiaceae bacterium]|nr:hypothetical protein [Polyangiaceae bacterium]
MKSAVALLFVGLLTACAASAPPAAQPEPAPPVPESVPAAPAPESTAAVGSGDSQSPRAQREQMVIQLLEGRIPETGIPTDAR